MQRYYQASNLMKTVEENLSACAHMSASGRFRWKTRR